MERRTLLRCLLLVFVVCHVTATEHDDELELEHNHVEDLNEVYIPAEPLELSNVHFYENFDDPDVSKKRWIVSRAQKEDQQGSKYDGIWEFQLPQRVIFGNDRALVLKSKAKHAAISAKLAKPFEFQSKPLFVQYEVNFQNGIDCGGAYIKLLSYSNNLDLAKFTDKTPYTIMFGPDKCGNDYKLHFIFRHKNPITGEFEEKHATKPSNRLEENYSDKKPHAYLLKLFPDNTFQVFVDGVLVNNGHLLEDMTPSVNPPMEIPDEKDRRPADWDEREKIVDSSANKPDDWDEEAPATIPDPSAVIPDGWLEDESPTIPDVSAKKPDDWDDGMDGEWDLPKIDNPACASVPGCGPWTPTQIPNPGFKGKWKQPMIPNPNYKGKWEPRLITNPKYFDDKEPFKMTSIGAVGIEIWAMTDLILFDNFIITDNDKVLQDWNSKTYELKRRIIEKDSEGVLMRTFNYTNAHPWLWAVYMVVIGLPLVLIITFCCGSQEKRDDARNKKTDEYVEDDEAELLNDSRQDDQMPSTSGTSVPRSDKSAEKENLELDVGAIGDGHNVDEYDEEEIEEEDEGVVDSEAETVSDASTPPKVSTASTDGPKKRSPRVD